jgi:hypothetical protein
MSSSKRSKYIEFRVNELEVVNPQTNNPLTGQRLGAALVATIASNDSLVGYDEN